MACRTSGRRCSDRVPPRTAPDRPGETPAPGRSSLLQRDLAQQVVGGAELQPQAGIVRRGGDQRIQQSPGAAGLSQSAGQVAAAPDDSPEQPSPTGCVAAQGRDSRCRREAGSRASRAPCRSSARRLGIPQARGLPALQVARSARRRRPARAAARGPRPLPAPGRRGSPARRGPAARGPAARRAGP